ncbi:MAG: radical SAM protein [Bacillota bacterium]|nr:radical SAM protein [Bacillota bacterium]
MDHQNISSTSGLSAYAKIEHLNRLAEYRKELQKQPQLRQLFIEMTMHCNQHCRHCGSKCGDVQEVSSLSKKEIMDVMQEVIDSFDMESFMFCITGGEPLLRKDLFEIMMVAKNANIPWGMTSNGTLITKVVALKLSECGMKTISISLDGLKESHEWFRNSLDSYEKTIQGIQNLLEVGIEHVQITTVIHALNIQELDAMYDLFSRFGVHSWRVIPIEPIGRAKEQKELLLSKEQYKTLFQFIKKNRFQKSMRMETGCSHFLGLNYEKEVRPWYFFCNAGLYTASICSNGDVTSCLDVERRKEYVEGNIREQSFKTIWETKFEKYRTDFRKVGKCASCKEYKYCQGDSFHSWDMDKMEPLVCFKKILF